MAGATGRASGAKGRASMRRLAALQSPEAETAPTRRQTARATGDDARARAYRQGRAAAGRALDERRRGRPTRGPAQVHDDPQLQGIYEQGHRDRVAQARRKAIADRAAPVVGKTRGTVDNGAGFVLGLLGFAMLRNYLQGGWSGVGAWLSAKFVNKTPAKASPNATHPYGRANPNQLKGQSPTNPGGVNPYQGLPGGVGGLGSFG